MCNLERNKIKYKQLNHIAITPILRGKPSKGKTMNNRSIINLDQIGQAGPSELASTHLPGHIITEYLKPYIGFITCKYHGHQYHMPKTMSQPTVGFIH